MPIMGIQQGMQPIIGYNHGAKLKKRTWQTFRLAAGGAVIFSTIVFLILEIFSPQAISLFLDPGSATIPMAIEGLRLFLLSLPVVSLNMLGVAFFQSTAQGAKSLILSMLRQFIFLIPLALTLPALFGLTGVWIATPIADALAVIVTLIALFHNYSKERKPQPESLLAKAS